MDHSFDTTRRRRLESLFLAAADLPDANRAAFVRREAADDPAVIEMLLGMLCHVDGMAGTLVAAVQSAVTALVREDVWVGRRFGPYCAVREIGRGGMGIVLEAERNDDQYHKRVALKVAPYWASEVDLQRFRQERQILAGLEHPNIARLLDGGTEAGVPYLVLELVEGEPITTYAKRKRLTVPDRLRLMGTVCQAVEAAHSRLIVHRDLKPANILIASDGVPKLLDFGIAKLLGSNRDLAATGGQGLWTPGFASPEQVRGEAITTRTDVYALGLILYELLTGRAAQTADPSSPAALEASVCEEVPPLPSASAPRGMARALRGDLDTIVMTAIAKDPARRYGSVSGLSNDLDRYLDGLPILARPATMTYRATRFVRRHRLGIAAVAVIAAILVGGIAATRYQAVQASRRFNQVRALANMFVFDVHDLVAQLPDSRHVRAAIVQTGLTYVNSLSTEAAADPVLAGELATAYHRIAVIQGDPRGDNLGAPADALESLRRAAALLEPFSTHAGTAELARAIEETRSRILKGLGRDDVPVMRRPNDVDDRPVAALTPGATVVAVYTAANQGRYAEAERYLSAEARAAFASDLVNKNGGSKTVWDIETRHGMVAQLEVTSETIDGDRATVMLRMRYVDGTIRDNPEVLVRENGRWKVDIS